MTRTSLALCVLLAPSSAGSAAAAMTQAVVQTLPVPLTALSPYFGPAVDVDRSRLAIASTGGFGPGFNSVGQVHLYDLTPTGWQVAHDVAGSMTFLAGGNYGSAVALDDDTLVVGNFQINSPANVGAVDIFRETSGGWVPVQTLQDGIGGDDHFGVSVAVDGDTLVVGARLEGSVAYRAGAAHVYERVGGTWTLAAQLFAPATHGGAFFGHSVDVEGDRILVGGYGYLGPPLVALYERDPAGVWRMQHVLEPADGTGEGYGRSVALEGGRAYVGHSRRITPGRARGSIDIFDVATGVHLDRITIPVAALADGLGYRLAVEGDLMIAGGNDPWSASPGRVSTFQRQPSGWKRIGTFTAGGLGLGSDLALADGLAVFGAARFNGTSEAFAAIVAPEPEVVCIGTGQTAIEATGVLTKTWRSARLSISGQPSGALGVLYFGPPSPPSTTMFGTLCLGSSPRRYGVAQADPTGTLVIAPNGRSGPLAAVQAGTTLAFQLVSRGPGGARASEAAVYVLTP